MNDFQENWHDFQVDSRRKIIALIRAIREKKQLMRMGVGSDVCVTTVLDVDPASDSVILDCSIDRSQDRRMMAAKRVHFETALDKIRIMFDSESLSEVSFEERPALRIAIPNSLIRLQRREFYRMETPVSNPVRIKIVLPESLGGGTQAFPLSDISCGGVAIVDNHLLMGTEIGMKFDGCLIELPDVGVVSTGLEIRNQIDLTLHNNKTSRRVGCKFINISRGNLANVQRFITKLERERNARIAGLG